MAFENIGIGGILSFSSGKAVKSMGKAQAGFFSLGKSAARLRTSMATLSTGISRFNLLAAGIGIVAGIAFTQLIRKGIAFNRTVENANTGIAGLITSVQGIPFEEAFGKAEDAVEKLNLIAAETPVSFNETLQIAQQLVGPVLAAGGEMATVLEFTKGAAIAAGELGFASRDVGRALGKLQAGTIDIGNDFIVMVKSMGLLKEETAEWRELLPEQRLVRMNEILGEFAARGEFVGKTFEAQLSTIGSVRDVLAGAFTKKLFDQVKVGLTTINALFFDNTTAALDFSKAMGERLGQAFNFLVEQTIIFGKTLRRVLGFLSTQVEKASGFLDRLGIGIDENITQNIAGAAFQFGAWFALIVPILALMFKLAGAIGGIFQIVSGLVGVFGALPALVGALLGPLGIVLALGAALFFVFQRNQDMFARLIGLGDRFKEAFLDILNTVQPILDRLLEDVVGIFDIIVEALTPVVDILLTVLETISAVIAPIFKTVFAFLEPVITLLIGVGKIIGKVFSVIFKALAIVVDFVASAFTDHMKPIFEFIAEKALPFMKEAADDVRFVIGFIIDGLNRAIAFLDRLLGNAREARSEVDAIRDGDVTRKLSIEDISDKAARQQAKTALDENAKSRQLVTPKLPSTRNPPVNVDVKLDQKTQLCVDGRRMSAATARHKTEIQERAGFNQPPWQRRMIQTTGETTP